MTGGRDRAQETCDGVRPTPLNTKDQISNLTNEIEHFTRTGIDNGVFSEHASQKVIKESYNLFIEQIWQLEGDFLEEATDLEDPVQAAKDVVDKRAFLSTAGVNCIDIRISLVTFRLHRMGE